VQRLLQQPGEVQDGFGLLLLRRIVIPRVVVFLVKSQLKHT